jgi:hypothetical protein
MKKHPFIISDNSVNTKGVIILSEGIDHSNFNGVMLYHHKDEILPIGSWEDISLKDGVIKANAIFDQDDEFAVRVEKKVEKKLINCCSISVAPDLDSIYLNDKGVPVVAKSRLREISITPIGSNLNAIRLCDESTGLDLPIINLSAKLKELANLPTPNKILMEKKELAAVLNLSDDTADAVILARVKAGEEAIAQLADTKKKAGLKLLDDAVAKKDITEGFKNKILSLTDDPEKIQELLNDAPKVVNLKDVTTQSQTLEAMSKQEENWTFSDYSKNNPTRLAEIQKNDKALYAALFKKEYGVEPKTK